MRLFLVANQSSYYFTFLRFNYGQSKKKSSSIAAVIFIMFFFSATRLNKFQGFGVVTLLGTERRVSHNSLVDHHDRRTAEGTTGL